MTTAQHLKFDLGMFRDVVPEALPEGACYLAENVLFDKLGCVRARGGVTAPVVTQTHNGDHLGALVLEGGTTSQFYALGVGAPVMRSINKTTGALQTMGGTNFGDIQEEGGRPYTHYGFLIWPCHSANYAAAGVSVAVAGGATGAVAARTFTTPGSVVLTAGDKLVPCAVADSPTTLMQVGQIIHVASAGTTYIGRVTRLVSTTSFEVYPTPTATITGTTVKTWNAFTPFDASVSGDNAYIGGKVGMSFQGRALLGNISRKDSTGANRLELFPRRVMFSSTLLEGDATGKNDYQGAVFISKNAFPDANYFDLPEQHAVTAMSPTGFGDAVVFSHFRSFRVTGNLSTQYGLEQSVTWAVREIPNSVGCMSERSLQRTPRGLVFAHGTGLYTTDGQSMQPLLYKRMQSWWMDKVKGPSFRIHGSAFLNGNHYYICGSSNSDWWGLMINLDTLACSFIIPNLNNVFGSSHSAVSINSAVQDPVDPAAIYGYQWWDTTGGSTLQGWSQLSRLDSMFNRTSANVLDGGPGANTVEYTFITQPYHEDTPTVQKFWRAATIRYRSLGGTPAPGMNIFRVSYELNPADAPVQTPSWYLMHQDAFAITGATNAIPIVLTIPTGHGFQVDDWVYVQNITGNLAANGKWRVQAVTATTCTLVGTAGNGTYGAATGTVEVLPHKDINIGSILATAVGLNKQEGAGAAIVYTFTSRNGGPPDNWELYGITHTFEEREPHVE